MAANPRKYFAGNEYLLGDSAYDVCFPFVVSSCDRPASLNSHNEKLNYLLTKNCIAVEHYIGIMKGAFPVLCEYAIHLTDDSAILRVCKLQ